MPGTVLKVGQVFHITCVACNPQKPKFHVLARIEPSPAFFLINSNPTAYQLAREHLMSSIIQVTPAQLAFLTHDSWLDCTQTMGGHSAETLESLVLKKSRDFKGRLEQAQRRAVRAIIGESKLLSRADKAAMLALW